MATTLSVVYISDHVVKVGHVGDSRVYHIRGNGIVTRTADQTELAELLKQNVLTAEQAKRYPRRNVLLSYLGPDSDFNLIETDFRVEEGDFLVLLTDGVYNEIRKSELVKLCTNSANATNFAERVKDLLEATGVRDDSSLVAIHV